MAKGVWLRFWVFDVEGRRKAIHYGWFRPWVVPYSTILLLRNCGAGGRHAAWMSGTNQSQKRP